jgi:hypothetical protein
MQPMDFVPEEQHDSSQALRACICLASSIRHEGLGETFESAGPKRPKEHSPGFTRGLPWVNPGLSFLAPSGRGPSDRMNDAKHVLKCLESLGKYPRPSGMVEGRVQPRVAKKSAQLCCPFAERRRREITSRVASVRSTAFFR